LLTTTVFLIVGSLSLNIVVVVVGGGVYSFLVVASLSHDRKMLAVAPVWLTMDSNVSRAPRVGHKKSRKGCAQCKRRHVKVCFVRPWA
jgi:hypothetical protein